MEVEEELLISAKPSRRVVALLLDLLINLAASIVLLIPSVIALINIGIKASWANIIALFVSSLSSGALIIAFLTFYFVCLPCLWEGQTIGKRVANIRVIDVDTNEGPNAKIMFLREASRILIFILSFGLSAIASLISLCTSDTHTTFHEQISSTRVVNVNIYREEDLGKRV